MSIRAGLVGLPNVGKSTLFNALTQSCIPAENYPFCTIEPHVAITQVPDARIKKLQGIFNSQKLLPATVQFVDIAGLVKGAASGEGLGNQFLSHIREVDLILHVLRCFEDSNIAHSGETIDPIADYDIIIHELMLKDVESVEKRQAKIAQLLKGSQNKPAEKKALEDEQKLLNQLSEALNDADSNRVKTLIDSANITTIPLLSAKKFLIIANITEAEITDDAYKNNKYYQSLIDHFGQDSVIPICARTESELMQLDDDEAEEMMGLIGLKETGLDRIIQATYQNLGLITFFTCGPKEIHAWPIAAHTPVREASGEIHSDLERGFICAEVFNCTDIFELGSENILKEKGKVRTEGAGYIVLDGDIIHVKFNV